MFTTTINFKLKIGSVINVKEEYKHIKPGKYVVHMITTGIYDPDMIESDDKQYFLERLDNDFRDDVLEESDLDIAPIEILDEKVDLYKVFYHDTTDDKDAEDLVYVLHGETLSNEYFNKRIEASYNWSSDTLERNVPDTKSWELVKENV